MKKLFVVMAVLALLGLSIAVQAGITIDTVTVGDPGNVGEHSGGLSDRMCGSVSYIYNIGKYEVTAGQYTAFLNSVADVSDTYGLYNPSMWSDTSYGCKIKQSGVPGSYSYSVSDNYANRPVNYVSYWDSCRFANWLGNSQGEDDTENGAYTLTTDGTTYNTVTRNAGWKWAVTSEDEWYKAAYYKGGSTNAGYWDYPTKSNTAPSNVGSDGYTDPGNHANYYNHDFTIGDPYYRTNVGEFEHSASAYGTFDQGGNVWEWNETIENGAYRDSRGGTFNGASLYLQASSRGYCFYPSIELYTLGFRVSQVPEPSSVIALLGGLVGILGMSASKSKGRLRP